MDPVWSFVIQQLLVLAGIIASVWIGVIFQSGPRRRVENLKLAGEALKVVKNEGQSASIEKFMDAESRALERTLAPGGFGVRMFALLGTAYAITLAISFWIFILVGGEVGSPSFWWFVAAAVVGFVIIVAVSLSARWILIRWFARAVRRAMLRA
jgi:hypothetical protein